MMTSLIVKEGSKPIRHLVSVILNERNVFHFIHKSRIIEVIVIEELIWV